MKNKAKLNLRLDFRSKIPIYVQVVNQVQAKVLSGTLQAGDQLPTVRVLASELGINFNTVARAYRLLDDVRIISTQHGRGTFVIDTPPAVLTDDLLREALKALANRFVEESFQLGFSFAEIKQMVNEQARAKKDASL